MTLNMFKQLLSFQRYFRWFFSGLDPIPNVNPIWRGPGTACTPEISDADVSRMYMETTYVHGTNKLRPPDYS